MISKKELREKILKRRNELSLEERNSKSNQITERLAAHEKFQKADKILLFASYKSEVDTTEIFEEAQRISKDVYYPRVQGSEMEFYRVQRGEELVEGYRGIREPEVDLEKQFQINPNEKVLVLVPGAVFDEEGNRIGYGGGYYDKYLQYLKRFMPEENVCKMALAFECQVVERGEISKEEHDIQLDIIVTEKRIIF